MKRFNYKSSFRENSPYYDALSNVQIDAANNSVGIADRLNTEKDSLTSKALTRSGMFDLHNSELAKVAKEVRNVANRHIVNWPFQYKDQNISRNS